MTIYTVHLPRVKTGDSVPLDFKRTDYQAKQKRLLGRYGLKPEISFDDFTTSAVIDWLDVTFGTLVSTQARWISEHIKTLTGEAVSVREIEPYDFPRFTARFQQPSMPLVKKALAAVEGRFSLAAEPTISGLEVSIDFTPKIPSDQGRARMVGVLARHLLPGRNVLMRTVDRPRFTWGNSLEDTKHLLGKPDDGPDHTQPLPWRRVRVPADYARLFTSGDQMPYVDATVYFGSEKSACLWRIMDKVVDQQNRQTGTSKALDDHEKRARIEVSLGVAEIRRLGITSLDDLRRFRFTNLQKEFFAFYLPTFAATDAVPVLNDRAVKEMRSQERVRKFLKAGVVGLQAMDHAWETRRASNRADIAKVLRSRGQPVARFKAGKGKHGTLLAYRELNKRVETALRHLAEGVGS